jgi:5-methylcytosine-specific restriction endonuclease McrA
MKTMRNITTARRPLKSLPPRLTTAPPLLAEPSSTVITGSDQRQALYSAAKWRRARRAFLLRNPICAECERNGLVVAATIVDHKLGHRGDWRSTFWDSAQWQAMCQPCHAKKSALEGQEWVREGRADV